MKPDLHDQNVAHSQPVEAILQQYSVKPHDGLSEEQITRQRIQYGLNTLPVAAPNPWWKRLLRQFHNLLIYVLLVAAILAGMLAEWLDMAVILAVVLVNVLIGFIQEGKAERALSAIQSMLSSEARVVRGGDHTVIDAQELVPGDILILEAGQKVPADVRIIESSSLQCQEAALTGESVPISKQTDAVDVEAPLADRRSMAFAGTLITYGQGVGVVTATGRHTELGLINQMLGRVDSLETPLIKQMNIFARYLTYVILGCAALLFFLGWVRGYELAYLFMAVVSLVVAAIPEGLPTILTVALALGVTTMASRHAIIRRLPAVETLGAVSTICSDKTGTLTRNEMMVVSALTEHQAYEVTGEGYASEGTIENWHNDDDALLWMTRISALCNDSTFKERDGVRIVLGDPMEAALLVFAERAGRSNRRLTPEWPRLKTLPFDSSHKYMATLHGYHDEQGVEHFYVFVKGAPEQLLKRCETDTDYWHNQIAKQAQEGRRVLGFAMCEVNEDTVLSHETLASGLRFLGITGLIDPPRAEAIQAVRECQEAGIAVRMITGDHALTASAIAAQLGITHADHVLTGADLERMSDDELIDRVHDTAVFARTTPEHKLRLVQALQAHGDIVAMTGDGVNDSPALKQANIGIAMGKSGTDAAREASEMVLTDDNFASIVHAVREGRTVYDNLKKAISFLLPVNGGESLAIMLALIFALTLPILPLQILWVNMVSSIVLALALAFERGERDIMQRPPRPAREALLSGALLWRITLVSALFTIGIFGIFQWASQQGFSDGYARTMAVNTLVAMEVWYLFSVRYLRRKSFSREGIKGTRPIFYAVSLVFVLQLIFTYAPFMQQWFATEGLRFEHGLLCIGVGVLVFVILEVEKFLRTWLQSRKINDAQAHG